MAPAPGHLLLPTARRLLKVAINKTGSLLRAKLPTAASSSPVLEAIPITSTYGGAARQPTHPLALLKQLRAHSGIYGGSYNNGGKRFLSSASTLRSFLRSYSPVTLPSNLPQARLAFRNSTRIGAVISKTSLGHGGRPFASTLRPSLTGGTLRRTTAGGYTLGGGARSFSSSAAAGQACCVTQNVAQGFRAMVLGGKGVRFDGVDLFTGQKRFKAVGKVEDQVLKKTMMGESCAQFGQKKIKGQKGAVLRWRLSPTITAVSATSTTGLEQANKPLASNFARAVRDLITVNNELKKLACLGDLPITLDYKSTGPELVVSFPGCDQRTVESLCNELRICRGWVVEDEGWSQDKDVEMALLFPFADSKGDSLTEDVSPERKYRQAQRYFQARDDEEWDGEEVAPPPFGAAESTLSDDGHDTPGTTTPTSTITSSTFFLDHQHQTSGSITPSLPPNDMNNHECHSLDSTSQFNDDDGSTPVLLPTTTSPNPPTSQVGNSSSSSNMMMSSINNNSYDGIEGIYRFLRECDHLRR